MKKISPLSFDEKKEILQQPVKSDIMTIYFKT